MKKSFWWIACAGLSVSCMSHQAARNPAQVVVPSQIDSYESPEVVEWAKQTSLPARQLIDSSPIASKVVTRSKELVPKAPSLRTEHLGHEFFVDKGSLKVVRPGSAEEILVDVTKMPAGSVVADFRPSPDGSKIAYGIAVGGSDEQTWQVLELTTKDKIDAPFRLKRFDFNWSLDSTAFFYTQWPSLKMDESADPQRRFRVLKHKLNTDFASDQIIFEDSSKPPYVVFGAAEVEPGKVLVYRLQGVAEVLQTVFLIDTSNESATTEAHQTQIFKPYQIYGRYLGTIQGNLIFRTTGNSFNKCANFCIESVNIKNPKMRKILVKNNPNAVMIQGAVVGGHIVMQYFNSQKTGTDRFESRVAIADGSGQILKSFAMKEFGLFPVGVMSPFSGTAASEKFWFNFSTFVDSTVAFSVRLKDLSITQLNTPPPTYDKNKINIELVDYPSKDGTLIPMHVFRRKDQPDKQKFAYLFYYGAIGIANFPSHTVKFQMVLELGGSVAVAYPRGGGEYGERWIKAGTTNKMTTFEDIAFASRFLRKTYDFDLDADGQKTIVASGRSFGGWHTFAMMTHFNSDFSAFIVGVPVFDLEHSMKNGNGWILVDDFGFQRKSDGTLVTDESQFIRVRKVDPARHLGKIPKAKPTIIFAGGRDTRTMPSQAYRGYLALTEKFGASAPIYLMSYPNTGHLSRPEGGSGDEINFLAKILNIQELKPLQ